ncbi:MAG: hypothetical protein U5L05_17935 [Rubrivivax sp.]|nr:hypothetical protein [Rubrivivax sp.]
MLWGYNGGVKAPPGDYEVVLTANGVTTRKPLRVLPDPRLPHITAADYAEQFRVASIVRDSMNTVNKTMQDLRDVRAQMEVLMGAAKRVGADAALKQQVDSLAAKMARLEVQFTQTKSRSGQDPIRFAGQIDNQWAELYGNLNGPNGYISGGTEGRPTKGAAERLGELSVRWEQLRVVWQEVVTKDLPALNATAKTLNLGGDRDPQGTVVP